MSNFQGLVRLPTYDIPNTEDVNLPGTQFNIAQGKNSHNQLCGNLDSGISAFIRVRLGITWLHVSARIIVAESYF